MDGYVMIGISLGMPELTPPGAMERQCAVASRLTESYSACLTAAYDAPPTPGGEVSYGYPYVHHERGYSSSSAEYYRSPTAAYRPGGSSSSGSSSSYLSAASSDTASAAAAAARRYYSGTGGLGSSAISSSRSTTSQVIGADFLSGEIALALAISPIS